VTDASLQVYTKKHQERPRADDFTSLPGMRAVANKTITNNVKRSLVGLWEVVGLLAAEMMWG